MTYLVSQEQRHEARLPHPHELVVAVFGAGAHPVGGAVLRVLVVDHHGAVLDDDLTVQRIRRVRVVVGHDAEVYHRSVILKAIYIYIYIYIYLLFIYLLFIYLTSHPRIIIFTVISKDLTCTFRAICHSARLSWMLVLTWVSPFVKDKCSG